VLNSAESNQYKICAESKHNEPCILWPHTGWAISQAERRKRKEKNDAINIHDKHWIFTA